MMKIQVQNAMNKVPRALVSFDDYPNFPLI